MSPRSLNPRDRAEIAADLAAQGIDATPEDVAGTFELFQTMAPFPMDGEPARPAYGPDWTYEPEPGEEALFSEEGESTGTTL